jgi:alkylhydroperoxidase/carboxymuconolactone decarboxylase family protein YurZ
MSEPAAPRADEREPAAGIRPAPPRADPAGQGGWPSPGEVAAANAYMRERMLFVPRMFQAINRYRPEFGRAFADYYEVGKRDRHLTRAVKELIFTAIGIATASPACLIHLVPALEAGATRAQLVETALVGTVAAGFLPGGAGIPYAAHYAAKVLETADRYLVGEPWEYARPADFSY